MCKPIIMCPPNYPLTEETTMTAPDRAPLDVSVVNDFTFTEVLDALGIAYTAEFPEDGGALVTIPAQVIDQDRAPDVVTCDACGATSESGWGDAPTCLDCTPFRDVCIVHMRTVVAMTCPLCVDDDVSRWRRAAIARHTYGAP